MSNKDFPEDEGRNYSDPASGKANKIMRGVFGIIMIIVYVGMGVLLLINFFNWDSDWAWTRYVVGVVLVIYGVYRAYRQVKGID